MPSQFRDKYYFLSNMYPHSITYKGVTYTCLEPAYQAQKTTDEDMKLAFTGIDGYKAKALGKKIILRSDWEQVKVMIMKELLLIKFSNSKLHSKLSNTTKCLSDCNKELYEFNDHHDNFWGFCTCNKCHNKDKLNKLGRLLMIIGNTSL